MLSNKVSCDFVEHDQRNAIRILISVTGRQDRTEEDIELASF